MRTSASTPSDWLPDADVTTHIRSGAAAEGSLKKQFQPWADSVATSRYGLPTAEAVRLAKRALVALIRSIRQNKDWKPGLASQLVQDQVFVYRMQHRGRLEQAWLDQYYAAAGNYLRHYVHRPDTSLPPHHQHNVLEEAQKRFIDTLLRPDFELTSTLSTYLIGIVKRVVNETERTGDAPFRRSGAPKNDRDREADSPTVISLETIRYFQRAHQLIDAALVQLSPTCQTIILTHYAIDATRMAAAARQPAVEEALTEADFRARFEVAMQQPGFVGTLKELALKLGLSPKKISDRHIDCLDRLVKAVVPQLVNNPDLTIATPIRRQLQARLTIARSRRQ